MLCCPDLRPLRSLSGRDLFFFIVSLVPNYSCTGHDTFIWIIFSRRFILVLCNWLFVAIFLLFRKTNPKSHCHSFVSNELLPLSIVQMLDSMFTLVKLWTRGNGKLNWSCYIPTSNCVITFLDCLSSNFLRNRVLIFHQLVVTISSSLICMCTKSSTVTSSE